MPTRIEINEELRQTKAALKGYDDWYKSTYIPWTKKYEEALASFEYESVPHTKANKKLLEKVVAILAREPRARRIILED